MEPSNSPATGQIYQLIPKIMQQVGAIGKGRKNTTQGYAFRGIDDVYNALQGPLADNGVFVVPAVTDKVREDRPTRDGKGTLIYTMLTVRHTFYAPDGSHVDAVTVGEAMDSGDKSSNKAMSAAMKYALIEVFSIPTEGDNDTENHTHAIAPRQQPARQAAQPKPSQTMAVLASREQCTELRDLLEKVRLPEGTVGRWLDKAKVKNFEEMDAVTIGRCINFCKERLPAVGAA